MANTLGTPNERQQLRELRVEEWSGLGLAALAIVASLAATQAAPGLALPLFLGGLAVLVLSGRAFVRRWDLSERLLLDPGAYEIAEIGRRAEQLAGLEERRRLAGAIRSLLADPGGPRRPRVELVSRELAELADELEDENLALDPICAARCRWLLRDCGSPLLEPAMPSDGLRIAIVRVRAGFERRA
jgi:membrane protein implicated in regulation of membrane protease activity